MQTSIGLLDAGGDGAYGAAGGAGGGVGAYGAARAGGGDGAPLPQRCSN